MNPLEPIHTELAECQDCYKCLRQCRVKAIQVRDGHARIVPAMCVLCGHCVRVCPVAAKRVREDVERVRVMLRIRERVVVSLAPSWVTEFGGVEAGKLIRALKLLGFAGVSETALGAEQVNAAAAELLREGGAGVWISSACPTVVALIQKHHPELVDRVCGMLSPVLAHCRLLRQEMGEDVGTVFVGPCIAKKHEADTSEGLLDAALTFRELREWLEREAITLDELEPRPEDVFIPRQAEEGAMYPVDGGMIAGIQANCGACDSRLMVFSGIEAVEQALGGLRDFEGEGPLFVEMLACEGGCVNGPQTAGRGGTILKRRQVLERTRYDAAALPRRRCVDLRNDRREEAVAPARYSEGEVREALKRVGKCGPEDELNCGGCGYDSCRDFAAAMLDGRAEACMCMGYMRQVARKQADALLRAMPSGVVIVDEGLRIRESNRRFAELMGPDTVRIYEAQPHLEGASLERVVPFHELFRRLLSRGLASLEKDVRVGSRFLHVTVFTIERHRLAGGILQDITAPAVQKERIVTQAREVITRNLATVQKIAYLLGENAAESEVILNSIVESFSTETLEKEGRDDG